MGYALDAVVSAADWSSMHDIRRAVLFAPPRKAVEYDENHPDDRAPGNRPYLLRRDGRPVAVARLDLRGDGSAVVRLVAVVEAEQRRGHGRVMDALIAAEARRFGARTLLVNAAPEATGFYRRIGWREAVWDPAELAGFAAECVQMKKPI